MLAVALAPPAGAHVTPVTPFVYASETATIELQAPNERDAPMTEFAVVVPADFRVVSAASDGSWRAEIDGTTATWRGGSLAPGAEKTFTLDVEAPSEPGPALFETEQGYPDGRVVRWDVPLTVAPAPETAPSQNLGWAVVTAAVGVVVLSGVALLAWRRGRPAAE